MLTHCRIDEIKVGPRFRKRLGNVEALARSIEELGLLHAIVIDQHLNLVAGRRRLEALKILIAKGADGYKNEVPVRQVNLDDLLAAEHDENVHRLDFAPSEAVAVAEALEARLSEQAKARQLAGLRQGQGNPVVPNWPDGESLGRTRDRLAACVGMGRTSLGKARVIVEAARRDPARYGDLVERMDKTGLVDPFFKELKKSKEEEVGHQQGQGLAYSQPGPDDPRPDLEHRAYRDIQVCSAEELLASLDHCVDAIVTEPRAFHAGGGAARRKMYADLARLSRQALKQNGALAIISRDSADNFSDLMAAVTPHLPYRAMIAIQWTQYSKPAGWWPVVVFSAGSPVAFSAGSGQPIQPRMAIRPYENDESQGIGDLIELLTKPLQLVADPFMGDLKGIVRIGRSRFQPVEAACLHLDRSFVGADPDGLFQGGFRGVDFDRLREMVEELRAATAGQRHFIWDGPKVASVIAEPSTFPAWMGTEKSRRTRQHADRIIRLVEICLNGVPTFTGGGPCPPGFARITREDMALLDWALDLASSGPLDAADLAELLNGEEAPDGPADAAPDWVTESYLEQPDQDHRRERDQEDRVPFDEAERDQDQRKGHRPPASE